ncbi:MAG: right-handed parallel beta-helix repeat-containing protein [Acidobacteriota bacterium]
MPNPLTERILRAARLTILLFVLTGASLVGATDYYVATDGSDAAAGTLEAPFGTIAHGLAAATQPGDTVWVRGGLYLPTTGQTMIFAGTAEAPITLSAFPGERPIIDGTHMPDGTPGLYINTSYVVVRGFEVRNAKSQGISVFGSSSRVHHVEIRDNVVHDSWMGGIYVGWQDIINRPHDVLVAGNLIYRNAQINRTKPHTSWPIASGSGPARRVRYLNNTIYDNWGEGLTFFLTEECEARGNTLHDNFSVQLYLDNASHCLLADNFAYSTGNPDFFRFDQPATGIMIANETYPFSNPSRDNTVINNVLVGNNRAIRYGSYQEGGGLVNTLIAHNTAYGATGGLVEIDLDAGHSNSQIRNNVFVQTAGQAVTWIDQPITGLTFDHNLWFGGFVLPAVTGPTDLLTAADFVAPGGTDALAYRLRPGSAGLDAGVGLVAVPTDYRGILRASPPDLGAFEVTLLFRDGFESGDANAWTLTFP